MNCKLSSPYFPDYLNTYMLVRKDNFKSTRIMGYWEFKPNIHVLPMITYQVYIRKDYFEF